ncbi:META domain-containing protein [uncultured Shimia sp.]|uniref:META domain-containing protein n=1 Tax=uncultured Shimia sp. TaxID=573152 RepID=UPI00261D6041|nr:META domain-containing protein [uncultured Shimia sp.]
MRFGFFAAATALSIAACATTETVTQYGGTAYDWKLVEIDGTAVTYDAELAFASDGGVHGEGPCNGFSGKQSKPYPWVDIQIDFVEELYCSGIDNEEAYLAALMEMTLIEVSGPNMVMSTDTGRQMVFKGI